MSMFSRLWKSKKERRFVDRNVREDDYFIDLPDLGNPWELQDPPSEHVVLSAATTGRLVNLSMHRFQDGLSPEDRLQGFIELFRIRTEAEPELGGTGKLVDHDSSTEGPVWWAQYVRIHPEADRHALCRMLCDSDRALVLYYEAYGLNKAAFDAEISAVCASFVIPTSTNAVS